MFGIVMGFLETASHNDSSRMFQSHSCEMEMPLGVIDRLDFNDFVMWFLERASPSRI